jgi:hypothetical protein
MAGGKISIRRKVPAVMITQTQHYDLPLIPPPMTRDQQLNLLRSHFLSPARLVVMSLKHHVDFPIKISSKDDMLWEVYSSVNKRYNKIPRNLIIDDLTLNSWKVVVAIYESDDDDDRLESFQASLSLYTAERLQQFVDDYYEFISQDTQDTYRDLYAQVQSAVIEYFFPTIETSDIFR